MEIEGSQPPRRMQWHQHVRVEEVQWEIDALQIVAVDEDTNRKWRQLVRRQIQVDQGCQVIKGAWIWIIIKWSVIKNIIFLIVIKVNICLSIILELKELSFFYKRHICKKSRYMCLYFCKEGRRLTDIVDLVSIKQESFRSCWNISRNFAQASRTAVDQLNICVTRTRIRTCVHNNTWRQQKNENIPNIHRVLTL